MKKYNQPYLLIFFFYFLLLPLNSFADKIEVFMSLKNNEANLRYGPSFEYPIKITYKKKYLPIVIIDRSETWMKTRDFENNSGWIHVSQISKRKTAINKKKNNLLYKKPTIYSKPIAKLEIGRLVIIKKCKIRWCKIKSGNFSGWVLKNSLWGKV